MSTRWESPGADVLGHLLPDLPATLHVALAGRGEPPLPLARLAAQGQLAELGEADLALTRAETGALLELRGVAADEARVTALHARTEGWAAGISLVAQTPGGLDLDAAVERGHVFDYLAEQVLADLSREGQQFLQATAVPERVNPELAVAVTGQQDAGARLTRLHRDGLFLQRLGARASGTATTPSSGRSSSGGWTRRGTSGAGRWSIAWPTPGWPWAIPPRPFRTSWPQATRAGPSMPWSPSPRRSRPARAPWSSQDGWPESPVRTWPPVRACCWPSRRCGSGEATSRTPSGSSVRSGS